VVSPGLHANHVFTNTATITATTVDSDPANNRDWVTLTVEARPAHFVYLPLVLKNH
jgi:hypothetical protein